MEEARQHPALRAATERASTPSRRFRQSAFGAPPRATRLAFRHADGRDDEYHWLRDPTYPELKDPAIRDYLLAESAYVERVLGGVADLRPAFLEEFRSLVIEDEAPPPDWRHGRWYGRRFEKGWEHPVLYRKDRIEGPATTFLDVNHEAAGHPYYALHGWAVSPDHRWFAFLEDTDGSERLRLRVRDLDIGADVRTFAAACSPGLAWSADSRHLFYIRQDERQRPRWMHCHQLDATGDDDLIYEEVDPAFTLTIGESESGRFLYIQSNASDASETRLVPLAAPETAARVIAPRRAGHEYSVADRGDDLLILTNDRHRNFRLVRAALAEPEEAGWAEVVAASDAVLLEEFGVARDFWWLAERSEGLQRVRVFRGDHRDAGAGIQIAFPDPAYTAMVTSGRQWDRGTLRVIYESPARPRTWFDYDVAERRLDLVKENSVPSHRPEDYVVERHWATAKDGARIPVSLVRHRSTPASGGAPLLLYGYGAYGASMNAGFAANRLPYLRRGMIWAIAHVRGGMEMGRAWYEDGKLLKKGNTFEDYIAVAEHLVAIGATRPGRIAAMGGSAGGLLMGVAVNRRPDLFGAVLALVPFVDVLSTMLDANLPLTPREYTEWGNPADPEFYALIRGYSPYDNVAAQAYPALYISAGVNDPRVTYWEPAKWAARLRATKTGDNVLLLRTQMEAGHGGKSGRYQALQEAAERLAFVVRALSLSKRSPV
jgi:oligopeptidase B